MVIPNREGKCCDAVIRQIERATGTKRTVVSDPELTGEGPPVDFALRWATRNTPSNTQRSCPLTTVSRQRERTRISVLVCRSGSLGHCRETPSTRSICRGVFHAQGAARRENAAGRGFTLGSTPRWTLCRPAHQRGADGRPMCMNSTNSVVDLTVGTASSRWHAQAMGFSRRERPDRSLSLSDRRTTRSCHSSKFCEGHSRRSAQNWRVARSFRQTP